MAGSTLQSIAPIFQVENMQRAIDFYTKVMGFAVEWSVGTPPERASMSRDRVEINLVLAPAPVPSHVYIEVDSVDAYYARVAAAGAKVLAPLADRPYRMRDGAITDPDGNTIGIGESLVRD